MRKHIKATKDRRVFCFAFLLVIMIDQLAKAGVQMFVTYTPLETVEAANAPSGPFSLIWVVNTEVFPQASKWPMIFGSLLFHGIFLHHGAFRLKTWRKLTPVPLAMFVGGAFSNIVEVLITGGVRNFLKLGFDHPLSALFSFIPARPLFSTAALFMLLGMLALPVTLLLERWMQPKDPLPPPPASGKREPLPKVALPTKRTSTES